MNIDSLLAKLPIVGVIFVRSYAFWRSHIAIANVTHIVFGMGLVLVFFLKFFAIGLILLSVTAAMHIIAFTPAKRKARQLAAEMQSLVPAGP